MKLFRHIVLMTLAVIALTAAAQQPDPVIASINDAYQQAKAATKKNKGMGSEMVTTLSYTVRGKGKTTETLHFYYNTVEGTYWLSDENADMDPHFNYYPLYFITRNYNIGNRDYHEEFLFDAKSQRLLFALTQDYDESGKRFDRRFYVHNGSVYSVEGPEATPFMQEGVIYQADELRHAFDWIIRNPKE